MASGNIVMTGASGLLGRHLVPLFDAGQRLYSLGRAGAPDWPEHVVPVEMDLSREIDPGALPRQAETVVYLAQSHRFREFPDAAMDIFQVNAAQLLGMLDYARRAGARSFVYASTGGVYAPADEPLGEDSPTAAESIGFYPATKLCGEMLVRTYAAFMNVSILRFFFIYGRGQKRDMLIPRLVDSVRDGRPVMLQGEQGLRINPIHAADAAAAVLAAAGLAGNHIINVAGPEILSIRGICETVGGILGKEPVFERSEEPPSHLVADNRLMIELLGGPRRRFRDGVADLIETG